MSTATNLLSLLNQLQLMENSLTNFMLETILKIQTLTETKVFLLLESSGGADSVRRFCGTSDLVESFENGRLHFRSTDVEVTLDPSIGSTIVEKPRFVTEQQRQRSSMERQVAKKRRSATNHGVDVASDTSNGAPPMKRQNLANDMAAAVEEEEENNVAFEGIIGVEGEDIVKREVVEYVIGDSDDEDDGSGQNSANIGCNAFVQRMTWPEGANAMEDQFRPTNDLSARKLEALQSIENPTAVFEKGTLENKLLSSILYDYGKELAFKCPYEDVTLASSEVKSYFYGNLEQFLSHFQRFSVEKPIVSELLKTQSPQSYMRNIARSGYKAAAKNAMKKRGGNPTGDGT